MKKLTSTLSCLFIGLSMQAAPPQAILAEKNFDFLANYCLNCHDEEKQEGKINLEDLDFHIKTIEQAETWQKVLNVMNSGEMPPEDKKQPKNDEKAEFLDELALTMVKAREVLSDSGGKITMRRLNRREYQNTMQEILGVTVDVEALPEDGGGGAYDTSGSTQFLSSDQFEQYLKMGKTAVLEAFKLRENKAFSSPMVFRVEPEETVNPFLYNELEEMDDIYLNYKAWIAEVDQVAALPENKKIMDELKKEDPKLVPGNIEFYRQANKLKGMPNPNKYGFRDHRRATFGNLVKNRSYAYFKHYLDLPHNDRGTYLKNVWGTNRILIKPPEGTLRPGKYKVRIKAGVVEGSEDFRHFIQLGHPQRTNHVRSGLADVMSTHHVSGSIENPNLIETEINISSSTPHEFAIQERQPSKNTALRKIYEATKKKNGYGLPPSIWVDWIEIEGPIAQKETTLDKTLKSHPVISSTNSHTAMTEFKQVRKFLTAFAKSAMRGREPSEKYIDQLMEIYDGERRNKEQLRVNWRKLVPSLAEPISIILASPGFIYLNEPGQDESRRALNDRELAVRLSYFLWSSPPDEELLKLVEEKKLRDPQILKQQVDRLITDPRADKFVAGLVHQWLDMKRLDFFQFNVALHRDFDDSTREAARQEVYQSFSHLMRGNEGGELGKLIKSDYVMVNGLLGTYYGLDGVEGDEFRKVKLPADSPRGGLLGTAAISAMGSDGLESSPVERGAWVLRHLLHQPPPPAPANVPQLSEVKGDKLTTRQKLLAHQAEPQCASCHRKIDPIGFGMENFSASGKWRTEEHFHAKGKKAMTWKIDPSGKFHKGPKFASFLEMRDRIYDEQDDFARGFTEALISYGLGRSYAFTDQELASQIVASAKKNNYAVSDFIHSLVQTEQFKSK
ncbi:hypothetical protein LNTAR_07409 [Lentisphaera araneosa HTCC2155]|uniref:Cytochrome c domain-containing protein n=1 Tax=Lentisphaera araneosa HTCC2155 TaxID=313628 RepID=A6DN17_9BACT|nr:DUF1592 domain-containing protein [Lentisphaera araneosa]EDM27053.1 hypothetical protein LNTAR_07409 [Lentisphaera araneosa HTCC2155]